MRDIQPDYGSKAQRSVTLASLAREPGLPSVGSRLISCKRGAIGETELGLILQLLQRLDARAQCLCMLLQLVGVRIHFPVDALIQRIGTRLQRGHLGLIAAERCLHRVGKPRY